MQVTLAGKKDDVAKAKEVPKQQILHSDRDPSVPAA